MSGSLQAILRPLRGEARLASLALLLFVTYAYFVPAPAWNENSRFALTRAVVEHGTTQIDRYHYTTGDKSQLDGHFYSDKAPGASLLAAVPYGLYYWLRRAVSAKGPDVEVVPLDPLDADAGRIPEPDALQPGDRLRYNPAFRIGLYVCNLGTNVVVSLLAIAAFYLLALRQLGDHRNRALGVTLVYALATPAFPYATVFYGHQLSAAFLVLGFAILVLLPRDMDKIRPGLAVGTCLGLAVLCEYPAALPVVALTVYAGLRHGRRLLVWTLMAGVLWAALLGGYHTLSFGSPVQTGYDFVYLPRFAEGMTVRYGISIPDPNVLVQLLFGSYRGLFYVSPVLLLAAWGLGMLCARKDGAGLPRGAYVLAACVVAYYLLLNAGYYMWDGGAAIGPRHCVAMLPFLALGLAPALVLVPRAFWILAALSLCHMLAATHASPGMPQWGDPLWGFAWPRLFHGGVTWYDGTANVGSLLGLPGPLALAPLAAVWLWLGRDLRGDGD